MARAGGSDAGGAGGDVGFLLGAWAVRSLEPRHLQGMPCTSDHRRRGGERWWRSMPAAGLGCDARKKHDYWK